MERRSNDFAPGSETEPSIGRDPLTGVASLLDKLSNNIADMYARQRRSNDSVPGIETELSIGRDPVTGAATAFVYGNAERMRHVAEMLERIDASNPSDPARRHWLKDRIEYRNLEVDPERFRRERFGYFPAEEES